MTKKKKLAISFVFFAVLLIVAFFSYRALLQTTTPERLNDQQESISISDRTLAPEFSVIDQNGKTVQLSSMRGKPVVVNFWASWCPPCKEEMPDFNKVAKEYGSSVSFMMIDLVDNRRETASVGAAYVKSQGFTFPIFFDELQEAANAYNVYSIPTTIFIDKDGYIIHKVTGAMNESSIKEAISMIQ